MNVYIFETRQPDYLKAYVAKAKKLGYNLIIVSPKDIQQSSRFDEFKAVFQHIGANTAEFELNCFARYFALESVIKADEQFILSDSDIYITNRVFDFNNPRFKDTFIGSDGYLNGVSEWQISPHFSIWNRALLKDFIDHLIASYIRNQQDSFLTAYYATQQGRLGYTSISDMTLLYLWVKERSVPFINSNNVEYNLGIDHNISTLTDECLMYQGEYTRKKIEVTSAGDVNFFLESGDRIPMSCVHFQGNYKYVLNDFYLGNYAKFNKFSEAPAPPKKKKGIFKWFKK